MTAPAARWPAPNRIATLLAAVEHEQQQEPTPLFDALTEYPTANPLRRAYLRDVIGVLSGGAVAADFRAELEREEGR